MDNKAENNDIVVYLEKTKQLLIAGKYDFVTRRKNMQALARYGLTIIDAKEELLGLTADDYYKGPKMDFDPNRPGEIWEFKKRIL